MERVRVSSGSPYEPVLGYCRAVRVGDHVYVAGSAPIMPEGAEPPADSYGQTRRCFEIVEAALAEAGAGLEDVVRTRVYLTPAADFDEVGRAHGDLFREIRPVNTTVVIHSLVDPRWLLEVDVDAVVGAGGTP
jgi:enamine deaminase RidA (YjgF/YER057c/UK114 family)